ncbi:MAG: hypothetical protein J7L15_02215 [Clostridiales bacterium]|nr:hypothetical protein [Clostridiales bacterium]
MTFKNYLVEEADQAEEMNEVLLTFGKRRPKYNQAVIIAGGAGSGKGFVIDNLIGLDDAKVMDVDDIKGKIISAKTPKLNKKIFDLYGIDVTKLDLTDPKNVSLLHNINDEMGISKKVQHNFFKDIRRLAKKEILPNVIFDSTAKSEKKIKEITDTLNAAGYKHENIHFVWVINSVDVAISQNLDPARGRVVPEDILIQTHELVAANISALLKNNKFDQYIGGDGYFVFNKRFVDSTMVFADQLLDKDGNEQKGRTGAYVKDALIVKIKEKGKRSKSYSELADVYLKKIKSYIPKSVQNLWD